jgi:hypothetical protein
MVRGDKQPLPPRLTVERHVGIDRHEHRAVIEAGGVDGRTGGRGERRGDDPGRGGGWRACSHRRMLPGPFE